MSDPEKEVVAVGNEEVEMKGDQSAAPLSPPEVQPKRRGKRGSSERGRLEVDEEEDDEDEDLEDRDHSSLYYKNSRIIEGAGSDDHGNKTDQGNGPEGDGSVRNPITTTMNNGAHRGQASMLGTNHHLGGRKRSLSPHHSANGKDLSKGAEAEQAGKRERREGGMMSLSGSGDDPMEVRFLISSRVSSFVFRVSGLLIFRFFSTNMQQAGAIIGRAGRNISMLRNNVSISR